MTERVQQEKRNAPAREPETVATEIGDVAIRGTATDTAKSPEELKAELDDLLDEIDEVLEENAEEFVRGYVQKGGE